MSGPDCREFEKALARGEEAVAALEAHAGECADCRDALRLWNEIPEAARSLRKSWESPRLFPGVARAIAAEKARTKEPSPAPRRRFVWVPAAAAAALFVLSMIGLYVFKPGESARDPLSTLAASRQPLMTEKTLADVETAESRYIESIENLAALAKPRLESPATPLLVNYREKLQLLDSAIAELKGQIEQNRFNTHLRRELIAMYQEKQRTLQDLMKEAQS